MERRTEYWLESGEEDLIAARTLLDRGHCRQALFFARMALEKALKAQITKRMQTQPPRLHNLTRLMEISGLEIEPSDAELLEQLNPWLLGGMYGDPVKKMVELETVQNYIQEAGELLEWMKGV
ncbi:MAG: HEPN domain-containing protein [Calditrichota bacterium]